MEALMKEVGDAAGKIWVALHNGGAMSKNRLAKTTGLSVALVNQGIGWLAREGKVSRVKEKKTETIRLNE